jgi:dTDP-glucose pyrophosphorylase
MKVIITMAGTGDRFRRAGYNCEKWRIEVLGRSLLEWSVMSLQAMFDSEFIFVTRVGVADADELTQRVRQVGLDPDQVSVISLEGHTRGQAESAIAASPRCADGDSVLIYNIDTYVRPGAIQPFDIRGAGWIPVFRAEGDRWSFVKADGRGRATAVAEKTRISDLCSVGLYYFASFGRFRELVRRRLNDGSEWYIAPLYQDMIANHEPVFVHEVSQSDVFVLGTPQDLVESTKRLLMDASARDALPEGTPQ